MNILQTKAAQGLLVVRRLLVDAWHRIAATRLRKAAERGGAAGQTDLGMVYEKGWGVPQNASEAVKRHRNAAEQGLAVAQSGPASMYHEGHGLPQDDAEAVRCCEAANQHCPPRPNTISASCTRMALVSHRTALRHMGVAALPDPTEWAGADPLLNSGNLAGYVAS